MSSKTNPTKPSSTDENECALLSELSLTSEWDTIIKDVAWSHLQELNEP